MRDEKFNESWPFIFKHTFDFMSSPRVKEYLEKELFAADEESMSQISESEFEEGGKDDQARDDERKFEEMAIEIAFDVFSLLSQKASFDQDAVTISNKVFVQKVLSELDRQQSWHCTYWVKFVFLLIVCNGGQHVVGNPLGALDQDDTV